MLYPKVSVLWLNYNSSSFMDSVIQSLEAVRDVDYPNYELIIVDNGSSDTSLLQIRAFTERSGLNHKLISLQRNLGFTGGCNVAYSARDRESKYIVLLNNDAVPFPDSLRHLVEEMERTELLGAAQGTILNHDGGKIDTAGDFLDELLIPHMLLQGCPASHTRKEHSATYADGAYSIYSVEAIRTVYNRDDIIFDDEMFAYFDDNVLGLKLWNHSFRVKAFPFAAAKHGRGQSFREARLLQLYLGTRNHLVLNRISNSRYKFLVDIHLLKKAPTSLFPSERRRKPHAATGGVARAHHNAINDGMRIGHSRRARGDWIDIYRAPILRLSPSAAILGSLTSMRASRKQIGEQLSRFSPNEQRASNTQCVNGWQPFKRKQND